MTRPEPMKAEDLATLLQLVPGDAPLYVLLAGNRLLPVTALLGNYKRGVERDLLSLDEKDAPCVVISMIA